MAATSTLTVFANQRPHKFHQKTIAPKPSSTAEKTMTLNMKGKNSKTNANKSISTSSSSQSENSVTSSVSTTTLLHNRISGAITNRGGRKNSSGMIQHPTLGYPVLPPQPAKSQLSPKVLSQLSPPSPKSFWSSHSIFAAWNIGPENKIPRLSDIFFKTETFGYQF